MGRIGGQLSIAVNGTLLLAKGSFSVNSGQPKREMRVGHDQVHGYTEMPQIPSIEGEITVPEGFDSEALKNTRDATVTLEAANGQTFTLRNAVYASDGVFQTEEGNLEVLFQGESMEVDP